ncbi:hypothetical protein [Sulfitobacter sp.]|uniref:hypothetical protein n=1 Tax=Sulfitobacter sp. TaxID=1903071 RepID=UPI0030037D06
MRNKVGGNRPAAEKLRVRAAENKFSLEIVELVVASQKSINVVVDRIEENQPLDVLVNNAGVMPTDLTEAYTLARVNDAVAPIQMEFINRVMPVYLKELASA